jgi:hypothetical protein
MRSGTGIEVDRSQSYLSTERAAATARRILVPGVNETDKIPSVTIFENLDNWVVNVDGRSIRLTYEVQPLLPGVEAQSRYVKERGRMSIVLSEKTYMGLLDEKPHDRFSMAHEIGHVVLHSTELVRMAELPHFVPALSRRKESNHSSYRDSEWQANAFAAALLSPARGVVALEASHPWGLEEAVAEQFGVSLTASHIRVGIVRGRRNSLLSI